MLLGLIEYHVWMKENDVLSQIVDIIGEENIEEKGYGLKFYRFDNVHLEYSEKEMLYRVIKGTECIFDPHRKGEVFINQ